MNGILIDIDPVIFSIGAFELRWYSLAIMMAVLSAVVIASLLSRRNGIDPGEIYSLAIWVVFAGIAGARLFHVFDQFDYYAANPLHILQFQRGGLAIWGGLAGGGIAAVIYARIRHIPLGRLADVLAPALLVAHIVGRFGCIINGDAYGGVTTLPWGFIYTHPNALIPPNLLGLPTHPYPVYEIIWNALALLVIWQISRHAKKDGLVFLSYASLYSLGRLVLSFVRLENITFYGLQQAQVIAALTLIVSLVAILYLTRRQPQAERPVMHQETTP